MNKLAFVAVKIVKLNVLSLLGIYSNLREECSSSSLGKLHFPLNIFHF